MGSSMSCYFAEETKILISYSQNKLKKDCTIYLKLQLRYSLGGITRVESYSSKCIKSILERTKSEPKESEKIAEYYGCKLGDVVSIRLG